MITTFIASFQDDMLTRVLSTMQASEPGSVSRVVVLDNGLTTAVKHQWGPRGVLFVQVPSDPFVFTQAFNIGLSKVSKKDDIAFFGDDVLITSDGWLTRLEMLFKDWPEEYGLLTSAEQSTSSVYGRLPHPDDVIELPDVAMGAGVILPRRILNEIGPWDDALIGYGFDDFDYGIRLFHAGYKLGITGAVTIENTVQARAWVKRLGSYEAMLAKQDINHARFMLKWLGRIPDKPWVVERPRMDVHWKRASCLCLDPPLVGWDNPNYLRSIRQRASER